MPYIPHTPESLIPRSDSKNPAATCCGLTSTGRPCRRARPLSSSSLAARSHDPNAFCWQHKDQATPSARALPRSLQIDTIRERSSLDTLADRLGLVEMDAPSACSKQPAKSSQTHQDHSNSQKSYFRRKPVPRTNLTLFCCIIGVAEDELVAPRPIHVKEKHRSSAPSKRKSTIQPMQEVKTTGQNRPHTPGTRTQSSHQRSSVPDLRPSPQNRPPLSHDPSSRTAELLSLIPSTTTPQTTSLLLAELAKPISIHDEQGYIYMFWLTPTTLPSAPPSETVASILSGSSSRPTHHARRTSEVLQAFSNLSPSPESTGASNKILLKIGRASNVQRRLNEWSRQCGHNLSLIRYYPYNSTPHSHTDINSVKGGVGTPTKAPHIHRIERLIHIELAAKRAKESGKCANCGSQHREWFEVEASREGVRGVDEVVKRWVNWAVRNP